VSERSEPRPARGASASEPVGDGVWGRSPHGSADVSERSEAFPFSAVVGADDAKLALLLAAVEPAIGGVLLRGDKGSAKTTLARGLAALRDGAPFVDLPLGATEERVVGSLDLAAALTGGEVRFQPGLLAAAHGGVLYVDEVNLLADHLVDVLLDRHDRMPGAEHSLLLHPADPPQPDVAVPVHLLCVHDRDVQLERAHRGELLAGERARHGRDVASVRGEVAADVPA